MENLSLQSDGAVAGFRVAVHRALTEPILLGGAPRSIAILNGTLAAALGLGLRLWIAGLASGSSRNSLPFGRPSAIRNSSRWCADICATPRILGLEERFDAEPRRISQEAAKPRRLPALGRTGRAGRRLEQGWLLPAHRTFPRTRSRQRHASRTRRRDGAAQQCAAASWLWLGDLRRGAAQSGAKLSVERVP